jgi:hypothetical protein
MCSETHLIVRTKRKTSWKILQTEKLDPLENTNIQQVAKKDFIVWKQRNGPFIKKYSSDMFFFDFLI